MRLFLSHDHRGAIRESDYLNLGFQQSPDGTTDVIITGLRGPVREERLAIVSNDSAISLHLLIVPSREHRPEATDVEVEVAEQVLRRWGFILPGSGSFSLQDWLDELDALSLLMGDYEEGSLMEYSRLPDHQDTMRLIDWIELFSRESSAAYQKARAEGRVVSVPLLSHSLDSGLPKRVRMVLEDIRKLSQEYVSALPPTMSRTREELQYLDRAAAFQETDREIFLAGTFSSGKTTLLNAMVFVYYETELPTAQKANTATTCHIHISERAKRPLYRLSRSKKVTTILKRLAFCDGESATVATTPSDEEAYRAVMRLKEAEREAQWFWVPYYSSEIEDEKRRGFAWETEASIECKTELTLDYIEADIRTFTGRKAWKQYSAIMGNLQDPQAENIGRFHRLDAIGDIVSATLRVSPISTETIEMEGHLHAPENRKVLECAAVPWLRSEITVDLPLRDELMCFDEVQIVDTPGFDSRHPAHDMVTKERLSLAGPEDIVLVLLRTSGSRPDRSITETSFRALRAVLRSSRESSIFVLMNWRSSPEGDTTELKKKTVVASEKMIREIWREEGRRGPPPKFFIADLLKTDNSELAAFRNEFAKALHDQLLTILKGIRSSLKSLRGTISEEWSEITKLSKQRKFQEFVSRANAVMTENSFTRSLEDELFSWAKEKELPRLREYKDALSSLSGGSSSSVSIFTQSCEAIIRELEEDEDFPIWRDPTKKTDCHRDSLRHALSRLKIGTSSSPLLSEYVKLIAEKVSLSARRMYPPMGKAFLDARPAGGNLAVQIRETSGKLAKLVEGGGFLKKVAKWWKNKVFRNWKRIRDNEMERVTDQIAGLEKLLKAWARRLVKLVAKHAQVISEEMINMKGSDYSGLDRKKIIGQLKTVAEACEQICSERKGG